ncbi:MAG: signal peptidase I [Clostridia bacterium]|nr:signal peptidase I [Clostridia bacterium]
MEEKKSFRENVREFTYEFVSVIVSAAVIIAIIFTFLFRFSGVSGESMEPTLHSGDWVVLSEMEKVKPEYGDIVVISQPNVYDEIIIKRVIATEGSEVDINFKKGQVKVDGIVISEPYINNKTTNSYDEEFPITVPKGYCFVMGDNRQHSVDSRSSAIGLIKNDYILGVAKVARSEGTFKTLSMEG